MGFYGRWSAALALTAVTLVSACGGPPPEKRSVEELLAIGQARLDEITIPAGWRLRGAPVAERSRGKLRWERHYQAYSAVDTAVRELDKQIVAAGWSHHANCDNGPGVACWTYDKGGLTIWPSAIDGTPCPAGHPVCAEVMISMRENFEEPI
ncbi:hypothetical protein ACIBTV_30895 [Micromonospora sp. NPDC049366]|uniref:hypothetical protein n=1 Tax=Micromonospora sp. NPDC049366 TaxID=3364271 RepID=UPI00379CEAD5